MKKGRERGEEMIHRKRRGEDQEREGIETREAIERVERQKGRRKGKEMYRKMCEIYHGRGKER